MSNQSTTLTPKVAALQFKMLHIQFRAVKISEDQSRLGEIACVDNRDKIKKFRNAAYSTIDMIICMEHIFGVLKDLLSMNELRTRMDIDLLKQINESKRAVARWKPVRNNVGGHLSIDAFSEFCEQHNYKGVFISNDLEADLGPLNMLAIGSAVNAARKSVDIFKRDLNIMEKADLEEFSNQLNKDWALALSYFSPVSEFLYSIGKAEKLAAAHPDDISGIVHGN